MRIKRFNEAKKWSREIIINEYENVNDIFNIARDMGIRVIIGGAFGPNTHNGRTNLQYIYLMRDKVPKGEFIKLSIDIYKRLDNDNFLHTERLMSDNSKSYIRLSDKLPFNVMPGSRARGDRHGDPYDDNRIHFDQLHNPKHLNTINTVGIKYSCYCVGATVKNSVIN